MTVRLPQVPSQRPSAGPEQSISVCDLYMVIYDAVVRDGSENVDHGAKGYYFGENGEHLWYDVSKGIAQGMIELGLTTNPEPTSFTAQELEKHWGSVVRILPLLIVYEFVSDWHAGIGRAKRNELPSPREALEGYRLEAQVHHAGHVGQYQA